MNMTFTVAPPTAPRTGSALAADRSADNDTKARGDLGNKAADDRRGQIRNAPLEKDTGCIGGDPIDQRT